MAVAEGVLVGSTTNENVGDKENIKATVREIVKEEIQNLAAILKEQGVDESTKALENMKGDMGNVSRQKEEDMAWTLAQLVRGEVVVSGYILKDEENEPITDIDAMVFGRWNQQEVIIFLEAKQVLKSKAQCRKVMAQLDHVLRYWEDLTNGVYEDADGDKNKGTAYRDLRVEEYQDRDVLYAVGADMYSPEARQYFQQLRRQPLLLISDPAHKYVQLVL